MRDLLRKIYRASPADAVRVLRRALGRAEPARPAARQAYRPVSAAFLRSPEYAREMSRHLPHPGVHDLHEAQNQTRSFRYRHHEVKDRLGVFRWRGLQAHLDEILDLATDPHLQVVDLGGAACPLGFGSIVVDSLARDGLGRPVRYARLADLDFAPDVIFSSHTLEHVEALEQLLAEIRERLAPGGQLILHLPAFTCERWRAGMHQSGLYNDHVWTFGLRGSDLPDDLARYVEIDALLEKDFAIAEASYCGDDSIYIAAHGPPEAASQSMAARKVRAALAR